MGCVYHDYLNNDRIPSFDELLTRCTQEETRMMERRMPSNGNDPTAFSTHAKMKNNANPKEQGQGRHGFKERRKGRCFNCNKFGHYVLIFHRAILIFALTVAFSLKH